MSPKGGTCDSTFVKEKVKGKIEEEKKERTKEVKTDFGLVLVSLKCSLSRLLHLKTERN